eukprot:scaffold553265_cov51-Prasinocladus_malaysianus.AAC.1
MTVLNSTGATIPIGLLKGQALASPTASARSVAIPWPGLVPITDGCNSSDCTAQTSGLFQASSATSPTSSVQVTTLWVVLCPSVDDCPMPLALLWAQVPWTQSHVQQRLGRPSDTWHGPQQRPLQADDQICRAKWQASQTQMFPLAESGCWPDADLFR